MSNTNIPDEDENESLNLEDLSPEQLDELMYKFEHLNLVACLYDAILVLIKTIDPEGGGKRIKALQEMHAEGKHYYKPPGFGGEA